MSPPEVSSRAQVKYLNKNTNTTIVGTSPAYLITANFTVENGRFFTESEIRYRDRVCVLGKTVADTLFEGAEPVGESVKIKNVGFRVLGVMKEKGASGWQNPGRSGFHTLFNRYETRFRGRLSLQHQYTGE